MATRIKFEVYGRMNACSLQRGHHYRTKAQGGGSGQGTYMPQLHIAIDVARGDGYSSDRQGGALNLYLMQPDLVSEIAAMWWERGMQTFAHGGVPDREDKGRVKFKITVEQVDE